MFFADERDTESLTGFLKSVLHLADDDYEVIEIADPHLLQEYNEDKLAIIDIKLHTKSRKIIHIEIQLKVTKELKSRIMYYGAKLITEQIGEKGKYRDINKVISIIITDESLIEGSTKYHHRFKVCEPETGIELSDLIEYHTIELCKLPDGADGTKLYDWAKFIAAETEEELNMLAERNPEVGRAVIKLKKMSADEKARDLYERRLKAMRDHAMHVDEAERKGRTDVARNLIGMSLPIDQIVKATGLSREEIENLK
jgi:predicted transposase/invertase (TIGR01784 family)